MTPDETTPEDRPASPAAVTPVQAAPQIETAEEHSGSDHVSHGANSNLSPAATPAGADAEAARVIEQQHQGEDPS